MSSREMFDQQQWMGISLSQIDSLDLENFVKTCTCLAEGDTELPTPIDVYNSFSNFIPEDKQAKDAKPGETYAQKFE